MELSYLTRKSWVSNLITAVLILISSITTGILITFLDSSFGEVSVQIILSAVVAIAFLIILFFNNWFFLMLILIFGTLPLSSISGGQFAIDSGVAGTTIDGVRLVLVVFGLIVLLAQRGSLLKFFSRWPLLLLFFIYATLSLIWSSDKVEGLRFLFKLLYPILLMALVYALVQKKEQVDKIYFYIVLAVSWNVVLGLTLYLLGSSFSERVVGFVAWQGVTRRSTGFVHPSGLSLFLAVGFLVVFLFYQRYRKPWLLVLMVGVFAQLILTLTRIGILALVIGMAILLFRVGSQRVKFVALAAILSIIALSLSYNPVRTRFLGSYSPDELSTNLIRDPITTVGALSTGRDTLYTRVWNEIFVAGGKPISGLGIGTSVARSRLFTQQGVHSDHLRLIIDLGVIGYSLYLLAIGHLMFTLLRESSKNYSNRVIQYVAFAALIQYLLAMITDNPIDYYAVFSQYVFVTVGLALASKNQPVGRIKLVS